MKKNFSYFFILFLSLMMFSTNIFAAQDGKIELDSCDFCSDLSNNFGFLTLPEDDKIPPPSKPSRREEPLLHEIINTGDLKKVTAAFNWNPFQLLKLDSTENSVLHIAAAGGHFEIITFLIDKYLNYKAWSSYKVLIKKNIAHKTAYQIADEKGHRGIAICLSLAENIFERRLTTKEKETIRLEKIQDEKEAQEEKTVTTSNKKSKKRKKDQSAQQRKKQQRTRAKNNKGTRR